jgi:hypothetical protein
VESDIQKLGISWREAAQDKDGWRRGTEEEENEEEGEVEGCSLRQSVNCRYYLF